MADIVAFRGKKTFDTEVALAAIQKLKRELEAQYGGITNEDWTRVFLAELIAHTAAGGHNPADYFTILGQEMQVYEPGDKVFEYL
jgi:hypothetical protein